MLLGKVYKFTVAQRQRRNADNIVSQTRAAIETSLAHFKRRQNPAKVVVPSYSREELHKKLVFGAVNINDYHYKTPEAIDHLLKRGMTKVEGTDKYTLNRDMVLRDNEPTYALPDSMLRAFYSKIRCPFLLLKFDHDLIEYKMPELYGQLLLRMINRDFHFIVIPNTSHHAHLNDPKLTYSVIEPFLKQYADYSPMQISKM